MFSFNKITVFTISFYFLISCSCDAGYGDASAGLVGVPDLEAALQASGAGRALVRAPATLEMDAGMVEGRTRPDTPRPFYASEGDEEGERLSGYEADGLSDFSEGDNSPVTRRDQFPFLLPRDSTPPPSDAGVSSASTTTPSSSSDLFSSSSVAGGAPVAPHGALRRAPEGTVAGAGGLRRSTAGPNLAERADGQDARAARGRVMPDMLEGYGPWTLSFLNGVEALGALGKLYEITGGFSKPWRALSPERRVYFSALLLDSARVMATTWGVPAEYIATSSEGDEQHWHRMMAFCTKYADAPLAVLEAGYLAYRFYNGDLWWAHCAFAYFSHNIACLTLAEYLYGKTRGAQARRVRRVAPETVADGVQAPMAPDVYAVSRSDGSGNTTDYSDPLAV